MIGAFLEINWKSLVDRQEFANASRSTRLCWIVATQAPAQAAASVSLFSLKTFICGPQQRFKLPADLWILLDYVPDRRISSNQTQAVLFKGVTFFLIERP
jgi:hypothetical protein